MSEIISEKALRQLVGEWIARGTRVAGPSRVKPDRILYVPLASAEQLALDGVRISNSIKEFVFPKHEKLYRYKISGNRIDLIDCEPEQTEQIIIGARPCDAAALEILDPVFDWDYPDAFYHARRQATTVVALACRSHDDACFCTSVGLGPASERGADALVLDMGGGEYEVRCVTEKGRALFAGKTQSSSRSAAVVKGPEKRFSPEAVRAFVQEHFDSRFWQEETPACLGCGVCTYTCPTCHCFDIADEGNAAGGARVRNWDSCQFPTFTLHASGHNPRNGQPSRQRQRIYHKFHIYPEKFGEILCTGCGNCTRNCPAGLGVLTLATQIDHG